MQKSLCIPPVGGAPYPYNKAIRFADAWPNKGCDQNLHFHTFQLSHLPPGYDPIMVDLDNLPERPLPNGMDSKHPPADITSHSLQQHFNSFLPLNHQHHDSTSTSASESADSSPTTTASVIDESDATEMSPGSSPESPMAKSSNPTLQFAHMRLRMSEDLRSAPQTTPFFELQRPSTPGKKARNLKNLAVNTTGALSSPRAASTTSLPVT